MPLLFALNRLHTSHPKSGVQLLALICLRTLEVSQCQSKALLVVLRLVVLMHLLQRCNS